jgi:putative transposon-encoded protein
MVKTKNKKGETIYKGKIVVDSFKRKVSNFGNSAHVTIPKKYLGDTAIVEIQRDYFICKGCLETITISDLKSPIEGLCKYCHREQQALKEDKCISCGGKGVKEKYFGKCEKCFNKPIKEEDVQEE